MVQFMAQRLMDMDVESLCGAAYDEKSAERLNSRNGFRDRSWDTRTGTVAPKIPKLRQGSYFPLEPRRTAEKALAAVTQEAYVHGVSTRSVDDLLKAMGMTGSFKSQVARLCGELDERVGAFSARKGVKPISGTTLSGWAGQVVSDAIDNFQLIRARTHGDRQEVDIRHGGRCHHVRQVPDAQQSSARLLGESARSTTGLGLPDGPNSTLKRHWVSQYCRL